MGRYAVFGSYVTNGTRQRSVTFAATAMCIMRSGVDIGAFSKRVLDHCAG